MSAEERMRKGRVIDAAQWLEARVDRLLEEQRYEDAIGYLRMLALNATERDEARQCATYLGYVYLIVENWEDSRQWLERARELLVSDDPHISYALGYVAMEEQRFGNAALHFLEAFVEGRESHDEAEFLRSAALALVRAVGPVAPAAAMVLGALDRDLGNPFILDALARVYAADERWLESLQTLTILADTVRDAARSMVVYRAPTACQLLRDRLLGRAAQPEDVQARARQINEALRAQFEVVLDARQHRGPTGLQPLRYPGPLGRLNRILEDRERGLELVESAQTLWAQATHADFHESLGPLKLVATIHLLVERLHWRVGSNPETVARLHGVSTGEVEAAARLVAGKLELDLFETTGLREVLGVNERKRLAEINQALLFGEPLAQTRRKTARLG